LFNIDKFVDFVVFQYCNFHKKTTL